MFNQITSLNVENKLSLKNIIYYQLKNILLKVKYEIKY